jgi:hypothetical protein
MTEKKLIQYSASQKKKMERQFRKTLRAIMPLLEEKYGPDEALIFHQEALLLFTDQIVHTLSYIGASNPYGGFLAQTAMALALYRVIEKQGGTLEEAAELIYKGMLLLVAGMSKTFLHLYGRWTNSKLYYPRLRKQARTSHLRRYPEDWVYDFVEGGQDFDYGIDMHECGILKYLVSQGAAELTPYLCAVDYITYHAMGVELRRSKTLAVGCSICNFRFRVHGKPLEPSWPPHFPEMDLQDSQPG